ALVPSSHSRHSKPADANSWTRILRLMASSSTTKICAREFFDMLSLDSDEKRLLIVFMPIFAKASELGINYRQGTEAQGADPQNVCKFASRLYQRRQRTFGKNDLVIGNELGCRYGW